MTGEVVVRASVAPMHAEARVSSVQISQRLAGHVVTVLSNEGDWMRVRGEDGYEGWMHRGYVGTEPGHLTPVDRRLSLGCVVRGSAGLRGFPLGAWVDGGEMIVNGYAIDETARADTFPRAAAAIVATAVDRFAGTPYQWGGVSPWGADCSGLVQTAFWLHGISLPRDAWQQADAGRDAGTTLSAFQPADLLFFSDRPDRRITHVGIALGGARMVHLALGRGGYAVERLDDTSDAYVTALTGRFISARRVLG